jgi:hypothetical protein
MNFIFNQSCMAGTDDLRIRHYTILGVKIGEEKSFYLSVFLTRFLSCSNNSIFFWKLLNFSYLRKIQHDPQQHLSSNKIIIINVKDFTNSNDLL